MNIIHRPNPIIFDIPHSPMDSQKPTETQLNIDEELARRRNVLVDIPYHHNLDLQQIFDTCRLYMTGIEQHLLSSSQSVLSRRINAVDQALTTCCPIFCDATELLEEPSYLLLLL